MSFTDVKLPETGLAAGVMVVCVTSKPVSIPFPFCAFTCR